MNNMKIDILLLFSSYFKIQVINEDSHIFHKI